jgi:cytidine deaminase
MKRVALKNLRDIDKELLMSARSAMEGAYNPYSNFFVGAAVLTADNSIVSGANFENAAYSVTVCAERAALLRAAGMGHKGFKRIAIIGRGAKAPTTEVLSPCGVCRQMIMEVSQISKKNIEVIMSSTNMKKIVTATIQELLPLGFGPDNLGLNVQRFRA